MPHLHCKHLFYSHLSHACVFTRMKMCGRAQRSAEKCECDSSVCTPPVAHTEVASTWVRNPQKSKLSLMSITNHLVNDRTTLKNELMLCLVSTWSPRRLQRSAQCSAMVAYLCLHRSAVHVSDTSMSSVRDCKENHLRTSY